MLDSITLARKGYSHTAGSREPITLRGRSFPQGVISGELARLASFSAPRQRIKEILLKRDLGKVPTSQEERILAYTHYAAGEQAVRMKVGPDTETGE
jgi:hypothetical protein